MSNGYYSTGDYNYGQVYQQDQQYFTGGTTTQYTGTSPGYSYEQTQYDSSNLYENQSYSQSSPYGETPSFNRNTASFPNPNRTYPATSASTSVSNYSGNQSQYQFPTQSTQSYGQSFNYSNSVQTPSPIGNFNSLQTQQSQTPQTQTQTQPTNNFMSNYPYSQMTPSSTPKTYPPNNKPNMSNNRGRGNNQRGGGRRGSQGRSQFQQNQPTQQYQQNQNLQQTQFSQSVTPTPQTQSNSSSLSAQLVSQFSPYYQAAVSSSSTPSSLGLPWGESNSQIQASSMSSLQSPQAIGTTRPSPPNTDVPTVVQALKQEVMKKASQGRLQVQDQPFSSVLAQQVSSSFHSTKPSPQTSHKQQIQQHLQQHQLLLQQKQMQQQQQHNQPQTQTSAHQHHQHQHQHQHQQHQHHQQQPQQHTQQNQQQQLQLAQKFAQQQQRQQQQKYLQQQQQQNVAKQKEMQQKLTQQQQQTQKTLFVQQQQIIKHRDNNRKEPQQRQNQQHIQSNNQPYQNNRGQGRGRGRQTARVGVSRGPVPMFSNQTPHVGRTLPRARLGNFAERLVRVPGSPFSSVERGLMDICARYPNLAVSSDFVNMTCYWAKSDAPEFYNLPLPNSVIVDPQLSIQSAPGAVDLSEPTAPTPGPKYYCRVMIMTNLKENADDSMHLANRINFLMVRDLRMRMLCPGGQWVEELDGPDPSNLETLKRTAIRCVQETLSIDLSPCTFNKFLDIRYRIKSETSTDAKGDEVVVTFLIPEVWKLEEDVLPFKPYQRTKTEEIEYKETVDEEVELDQEEKEAKYKEWEDRKQQLQYELLSIQEMGDDLDEKELLRMEEIQRDLEYLDNTPIIAKKTVKKQISKNRTITHVLLKPILTQLHALVEFNQNQVKGLEFDTTFEIKTFALTFDEMLRRDFGIQILSWLKEYRVRKEVEDKERMVKREKELQEAKERRAIVDAHERKKKEKEQRRLVKEEQLKAILQDKERRRNEGEEVSDEEVDLQNFESEEEEDEEPPLPPPPAPRKIVWEVDDEQIKPFLYFDQSMTTPSGLIKRSDLEGLLYSMNELSYREVQDLLTPINMAAGANAVTAFSNPAFNYKRACSIAKEVSLLDEKQDSSHNQTIYNYQQNELDMAEYIQQQQQLHLQHHHQQQQQQQNLYHQMQDEDEDQEEEEDEDDPTNYANGHYDDQE